MINATVTPARACFNGVGRGPAFAIEGKLWFLANLLTAFCSLAFCLLPGSGCFGAEVTPLAFNLNQIHQLEIRQIAAGELEFVTQGEDPYCVLERFDSRQVTEAQTVLAFEYFSPQEVAGLEVYFGPPITASQHFAAGNLERAESWLPHSIDLKSLSGGKWSREDNLLRVDFGRRPDVTFRIRNLHLREPNAEELQSQAQRDSERQAKLRRAARVDAFYLKTFPDQIDSVRIEEQSIEIRGQLRSAQSTIRLIEVLPEISLADNVLILDNAFVLQASKGILDTEHRIATGTFRVHVPRIRMRRDRTTSRWALAKLRPDGDWELSSHWKYASDLSSATALEMPALVPKSIKGMGGVSAHLPLEELVELGVHNITVNIVLTNLLKLEPHNGWAPFRHAGRTWYANEERLAVYDQLVRFAQDQDMVVSGILLVGFADSSFGKLLVHPEADRAGHYAMPNFTTADGVAAYEAVMELLSQRYCAPKSNNGRIANWIIHNEVGFGWEWTNMGSQPASIYMDHYLRSMRLVHNVTRRYDPHSRVFISLTHHWNTPGSASWRSYRNLDLINRLVQSSRTEGDFAWGVAFHPYPESLRRPDAWRDTKVTDDFTSPQITPKNIAVLDRWMHRTDMRDASGEVRGLLLSEQGFNSPDYSRESQVRQAAGLVYMWRQMEGLESIEAFHNHRWVDAAGEGGLLLGLRKLPSDGRPFGDKKLSWDVYKSLGTPSQARVAAFADDVIGME